METSGFVLWKVGILVLALVEASSATLSPTGINYEGQFLCRSCCFLVAFLQLDLEMENGIFLLELQNGDFGHFFKIYFILFFKKLTFIIMAKTTSRGKEHVRIDWSLYF